MKSRHLYWLLLFGCLVALFFAKNTYAEMVYVENLHTPFGTGIELQYNSSQLFVFQYFIPEADFNLSKIKVHCWLVDAGSTYYVSLYEGTNFIASSSIKTLPSADYYEFLFDDISVNASTTYNFRINYVSGIYSEWSGNTYNDFTDYYLDGCLGGDNSSYFPNCSQGTLWHTNDLWFQIYGTTITNSVSINTISTSTTAEILFQWQYQLDSATTSLGYYTIFADWDLYKCDPDCDTKIGSNLGYNSHPNSNIATGTTAGFSLDNGNYQIKNFYLKYDSVGEGSITASTTKVDSNEFSVSYSSPYIPIISLPTSTISTTTSIQITCDPNDNWFSFSLCKLGIWLFVPSQSALSQFSNLTADISQKPPIGYFTSIKNALTGLTSSTPAFTLDIDDNDPVATNFFTPIRTGLIWILWLAFAFWIFHRFRHFNFTSP